MKATYPYLNFNGTPEEAFNFYKSVFGGDFAMLVRFKDFGGNEMGIPQSEQHKLAHISLPLGNDAMLMASDVVGSGGDELVVGNNTYIMLAPESADEAERVFNGLAAGGSIKMPLQRTEWAEKYGICTDQFGVQWMVSYAGQVQFPGDRNTA